MRYTVREAKTNLSRLLDEACAGKEVTIKRAGKPLVKLVAISSEVRKRVPGRLSGQISYAADAFATLTGRQLSDLGFE